MTDRTINICVEEKVHNLRLTIPCFKDQKLSISWRRPERTPPIDDNIMLKSEAPEVNPTPIRDVELSMSIVLSGSQHNLDGLIDEQK